MKSDFYTGLIGLEADINANNKVGVFFGAGKTKFKGGHDGKIDSNDLHFGIYGQSKFEPVVWTMALLTRIRTVTQIVQSSLKIRFSEPPRVTTLKWLRSLVKRHIQV